ncbi:MAG: hypothetical protein CM1200mP3_03170 [Chloroflexota bacterium]|nr:MAG: hypothetical protein CM1200mP3_03170 [Chloroflexota bacterium]
MPICSEMESCMLLEINVTDLPQNYLNHLVDKTVLNTLDMYDLHNHLLPGIDDGPVKPEETLQIMEICGNQGVKEILATPHRKDVNKKPFGRICT